MSDTYEAWQEATRRLADEPESTFLRRVVEALQPEALLDYLASFRGLDGMEEPLDCDSETAAVFLFGLDELRQPPATAVDEERINLAIKVDEVLHKMHRLPWSGDHLYGDALEDARVVLRHVLAGNKGWPVLERFRCPSLYAGAAPGSEPRCQKQLPHEGDHSNKDSEGRGLNWTDAESTNPPKAYDSDAEELSGHPVRKVDRLPAGVLDDHLCAAKRTTAGLMQRCGLTAGHIGDHQDDGSMARWS